MRLLLLLLILPSLSYAGLKASIFNIKPWGYVDKNGNPAGIDAEIVNAISKELKQEIKIDVVPYKRMMHQLSYGQTDFAIFFKSSKSEKVAEPVIKWGELDIIVIGMKGQSIEKYSDLKNKRIGVRLGGYFHPKFDSDKSLRKQSFANYEDSIVSLKKDKVDLVIGTAATLYYEFAKQGLELSDLSEPYYIGVKEDWLHFSRKSKNLKSKSEVENAIKVLLNKGVFSQIFSKYLPKKWQHK